MVDQPISEALREQLWSGPYAVAALIYLVLFIYKRPSYTKHHNRWNYKLQHHELNNPHRGLTSYAGDSALLWRALKVWPMAMLFLALMLASLLASLLPSTLAAAVEWSPILWFPALYGVLFAISIYKWVVLYIIGFVINDYNLSRELFNLRYHNLSEWFVALSPLLLLQYINFSGSYLISSATIIILICCYLTHLWFTFSIFAIQKISIVNWFLYLCAVELLPASFAWALYIKNIG